MKDMNLDSGIRNPESELHNLQFSNMTVSNMTVSNMRVSKMNCSISYWTFDLL